MLRTVYTPNSNCISFPIPDKYVGVELEILIFPISDSSTSNMKKKAPNADASFGAWADMDKTTEEICSEIRSSRTFQNKDLIL